jgi:hypothetical protein
VTAAVLRALLPASGDLLALMAALPAAGLLGSLDAAAASAAAGRVPACRKAGEACRIPKARG